jgi:hypothetical protein
MVSLVGVGKGTNYELGTCWKHPYPGALPILMALR